MKNKRIYKWDNLKFVLITLVVIGHFVDVYNDSKCFKSIFLFIYAFHMPLFLFVSGMFHKNENIMKKIFVYISIGYLYKMILYSVSHLIGGSWRFSLLTEPTVPWYMFALAAFVGITYLLRNINPLLVLVMSVLIACFVGYDNSVKDFLVLSRIVVFFPCYYLGTMVKEEKLRKWSEKKIFIVVGLCVLMIWAVVCISHIEDVYILRHLFVGRNPFKARIKDIGCFLRLLCYALSIVLGLSVILIIPDRKLPFVSYIGRHTMQIYFWHRTVLMLIMKTGLVNILCSTAKGKFLYLLIAIFMTFLLSLKIFEFPTSTIMKKV